VTSTRTEWEPVIGLETHVELATRTKMFCACQTGFGAPPNTQICPTCLGLPGSLPVTNEAAVRYTVMIGLALNCRVADWCRFARKNYFYPDMPKNFQISQYDEPLCVDGYLDVEWAGATHRVRIERVHLEEDTGKTLHVGGATGRIHGATHSLVDYNRAGIPLVEIVTRPDVRSAEVARAYVAELRELLRALGVSDVRMEQGSLRCDVNVSLRPAGSTALGDRTETKNLNSLRSVERAVHHEIERQAGILDGGGRITLETRHFHEDSGVTTAGRSKETAEDYRYFPEPDLVPLAPARDWVAEIEAALPELPAARRRQLATVFGFSALDVDQMTRAGVQDLVAATVAAGAPPAEARAWWLNDLVRAATERSVEPADLPVTPEQVARLIGLVSDGVLTTALARQVLDAVLAGEGSPDQVVAARRLQVLGDDVLLSAVDAAIAARPDIAEKVRSGKTAAVGALVGDVMRSTGGQADAARARELLLQRLGG
jgi:aspartyl-tRNA(Asn)/glutamyl-tRNA(Gln) amidotransferase subunit B